MGGEKCFATLRMQDVRWRFAKLTWMVERTERMRWMETEGRKRTNGRVYAHRSEKIVSQCDPRERRYILDHTRESDWLRELRERTSELPGNKMQVPPEQAQFMALLVELIGARKIVEVGVYTGYSSLAMAMALPEDGMLIAIDRDQETMRMAQEYWDKAGVSAVVVPKCGSAKEILQGMVQEGEENSYDLAFIDADKRAYLDYYKLCLQLVRPSGVILVDNTLFYGQVANPSTDTKLANALRQFNDFVYEDKRVSHSLVPIGDGLTLCRKR
mmetsp:Transcript_352/g.2767  ORF Transcript_352/g.2767 Transcript_352/m.2767 type:complete len:271 (-) Transcript_352:2064-2876(-)